MTIDNSIPGQERREFFRLNFSTPLQFKSYSAEKVTAKTGESAGRGTSENLSQSGILFNTKNHPPQLSSIVWLNLDMRTLQICREIESRALILNNGVLGRVVRVEEDTAHQNTFDVGVCFLTKEQKNSREVQQILAEVSAA